MSTRGRAHSRSRLISPGRRKRAEVGRQAEAVVSAEVELMYGTLKVRDQAEAAGVPADQLPDMDQAAELSSNVFTILCNGSDLVPIERFREAAQTCFELSAVENALDKARDASSEMGDASQGTADGISPFEFKVWVVCVMKGCYQPAKFKYAGNQLVKGVAKFVEAHPAPSNDHGHSEVSAEVASFNQAMQSTADAPEEEEQSPVLPEPETQPEPETAPAPVVATPDSEAKRDRIKAATEEARELLKAAAEAQAEGNNYAQAEKESAAEAKKAQEIEERQLARAAAMSRPIEASSKPVSKPGTGPAGAVLESAVSRATQQASALEHLIQQEAERKKRAKERLEALGGKADLIVASTEAATKADQEPAEKEPLCHINGLPVYEDTPEEDMYKARSRDPSPRHSKSEEPVAEPSTSDHGHSEVNAEVASFTQAMEAASDEKPAEEASAEEKPAFVSDDKPVQQEFSPVTELQSQLDEHVKQETLTEIKAGLENAQHPESEPANQDPLCYINGLPVYEDTPEEDMNKIRSRDPSPRRTRSEEPVAEPSTSDHGHSEVNAEVASFTQAMEAASDEKPAEEAPAEEKPAFVSDDKPVQQEFSPVTELRGQLDEHVKQETLTEIKAGLENVQHPQEPKAASYDLASTEPRSQGGAPPRSRSAAKSRPPPMPKPVEQQKAEPAVADEAQSPQAEDASMTEDVPLSPEEEAINTTRCETLVDLANGLKRERAILTSQMGQGGADEGAEERLKKINERITTLTAEITSLGGSYSAEEVYCLNTLHADPVCQDLSPEDKEATMPVFGTKVIVVKRSRSPVPPLDVSKLKNLNSELCQVQEEMISSPRSQRKALKAKADELEREIERRSSPRLSARENAHAAVNAEVASFKTDMDSWASFEDQIHADTNSSTDYARAVVKTRMDDKIEADLSHDRRIGDLEEKIHTNDDWRDATERAARHATAWDALVKEEEGRRSRSHSRRGSRAGTPENSPRLGMSAEEMEQARKKLMEDKRLEQEAREAESERLAEEAQRLMEEEEKLAEAAKLSMEEEISKARDRRKEMQHSMVADEASILQEAKKFMEKDMIVKELTLRQSPTATDTLAEQQRLQAESEDKVMSKLSAQDREIAAVARFEEEKRKASLVITAEAQERKRRNADAMLAKEEEAMMLHGEAILKAKAGIVDDEEADEWMTASQKAMRQASRLESLLQQEDARKKRSAARFDALQSVRSKAEVAKSEAARERHTQQYSISDQRSAERKERLAKQGAARQRADEARWAAAEAKWEEDRKRAAEEAAAIKAAALEQQKRAAEYRASLKAQVLERKYAADDKVSAKDRLEHGEREAHVHQALVKKRVEEQKRAAAEQLAAENRVEEEKLEGQRAQYEQQRAQYEQLKLERMAMEEAEAALAQKVESGSDTLLEEIQAAAVAAAADRKHLEDTMAEAGKQMDTVHKRTVVMQVEEEKRRSRLGIEGLGVSPKRRAISEARQAAENKAEPSVAEKRADAVAAQRKVEDNVKAMERAKEAAEKRKSEAQARASEEMKKAHEWAKAAEERKAATQKRRASLGNRPAEADRKLAAEATQNSVAEERRKRAQARATTTSGLQVTSLSGRSRDGPAVGMGRDAFIASGGTAKDFETFDVNSDGVLSQDEADTLRGIQEARQLVADQKKLSAGDSKAAGGIARRTDTYTRGSTSLSPSERKRRPSLDAMEKRAEMLLSGEIKLPSKAKPESKARPTDLQWNEQDEKARMRAQRNKNLKYQQDKLLARAGL